MLQDYRPNRSNLTKAERYQCDIDAVDAGIPVREAAKRFEVARESLRLRFLGLRPLDCRCGPQLLYINEDVYSRPSNFALRGRRHLSLDTLNVACLSLKMVDSVARPRPKGDFVDTAASGGKLLTYEEMEAVAESKAAAAEAKVKAKREAAEARAAKKVEAAALKTARQTAAAAARLRRHSERRERL
ncbi:hypothetical protein PC129_g22838 [Phytophthora cactorum]|uniref:HTH psq-type domain-containing protein n=1 Tax=Phytophthora cactorum TaxID=29920 RepID=A0A329RAE6_9STRA|nr:hypothetical protein PC114_g25957 [Phytophthora cactorum]KAG2878497.1 hypothetical protein PC115_g23048 [Phytophthora cactorum]KAG2914796.1 hypothetical protein PC117_g18213 [Phytophthora cactorum]KAG3051871.1 hypothetical protein PC121_g17607 [Phytophthora cactorum]KAG3166517.1 hypothetical protein PC128_g19701 [Phytophthora cactorum]